MFRLKIGLGLVGSVILILSSAAHTLLGWKQLDSELARTNVPADLALGLKFGWQFGGIAMLTFGLITIFHFVDKLRGGGGYRLTVALVAAMYVCFGAWAFMTSGFNPFFFIFIVPGVLFAIALTATSERPR